MALSLPTQTIPDTRAIRTRVFLIRSVPECQSNDHHCLVQLRTEQVEAVKFTPALFP